MISNNDLSSPPKQSSSSLRTLITPNVKSTTTNTSKSSSSSIGTHSGGLVHSLGKFGMAIQHQHSLNQRSLCVGDLISIYYQGDDENNDSNNNSSSDDMSDEIGFMSVKGFTSNARCGLEDISDENLPSNFKSCVFVVQQAYSYNAHKEFYQKIEQLNLKIKSMNQTKTSNTGASSSNANSASATGNSSPSGNVTNVVTSNNLTSATTSTIPSSINPPNTSLTGIIKGDLNTSSTQLTLGLNESVVGGDTHPNRVLSSSHGANFGQAASVKTFIRSHQFHFLDLTEEQRAQIEDLERKMEREKQQNMIESDRNMGREILYGQPIQLMHLKTKKYLCVNPREKAEKQKDCLKLTLVSEESINSTAHFVVLPYYKFRSEGDAVKLSDQVRFYNRKSNTFLHLGRYKYSELLPSHLSANSQMSSISSQLTVDEDSRKEIHMIPGTSFTSSYSRTNWRIRLFSPYLGVNSNTLKAGDVIRLYHTELRGFLTVNTKTGRVECIGHSKSHSHSSGSTLQGEKHNLPFKSKKSNEVNETPSIDKYSSQTDTLWEVEMLDPTRGGALMWFGKYRLKHISTGKYLFATNDSRLFLQSDQDDSGLLMEDLSLDEDDDEFGVSGAFFSKLSNRVKKSTKTPVTDFSKDPRHDPFSRASAYNDSTASLSSAVSTPSASSSHNSTDHLWRLLKKKLLSSVKKEQIGVSLHLAVKEDLGSEDTTFVILPHDAASASTSQHDPAISTLHNYPIPLQSYFRLKHAHTQTWVHGVHSDSGVGSSLMRADETDSVNDKKSTKMEPIKKKVKKNGSKNTYPLYSTNVLYEQDVFSVYRVPQQELEDLLFVQSIIPMIESFTKKVQARVIKRPDDFKVLMQTLLPAISQLIYFLTDSDEEDPLKREGIPFKNRQNILRERGIIDMIMQLIEQLVDQVPEMVSSGDTLLKVVFQQNDSSWTESDLASYHYLIRNLYRVVKQSVKLNTENGLYMAKYITQIQQHIKLDVGASVALIEILTNNYNLLVRMPKEQIKYFVTLLVDEEENMSDESLSSPRKLLSPRLPGSPSPRKSNKQQEEINLGESDTSAAEEQYVSGKNRIYLSFLSALCACGNRPIKNNQNFITKLLFEDECVNNALMFPYFADENTKSKICMKVNGVEYELAEFVSKALVQIMSANSSTMFDVQDDFVVLLYFFQKQIELFSLLCLGRNKQAIEYIEKKFTYELVLACIKDKRLTFELRSSFCTLLLNCFLDVDPYETNPTVSLTRKWTEIEKMKKNQDEKRLKELRSFLTDFFKENYELDCGNDITSIQKNIFMYNLTFMTRKMFELGMFDLSNIYPTHRVVVELLKVLDCSSDKLNGKSALDAIYEENEQTLITTKIKQEVCNIFDIIKSQQLNVRVDFFLINFKYSFTVSDKSVSEDKRQDFVKNSLFKDSIFNDSASTETLTKILIDLTKSKNAELAVKALNLLIRIHREKEELKELLPKIELLVSSTVIRSYDNILEILKEIKNVIDLAQFTSGSSLEDYSKLIQQHFERIEEDYEKNGSRTQRILRNLSGHEIAIETLTKTFSDNRCQGRIHRSCVRFLINFVKKNNENQAILFPYLEFFMTKIGQELGVSTLLCEIMRNNRGLCSMIEEKHVRSMIDLMAEHGLKPRYLNFLKIILNNTEGNPIKRNQSMVTQNLLDRRKDVIVLFNDEEGIKERDKRIKNLEHENQPDGILCYHIELLSLLAECGDGRNHVAEVKLQSLLSMEDILKQLLSPNTIPELRNPLLRFLDEVYINADKVQDEKQLSSSAPIFRLIAKMTRELSLFVTSPNLNRRSTEIILDSISTPTDLSAPTKSTGNATVHNRATTESQDSNPLELAKSSFVLKWKKPLDGQDDSSLTSFDKDEKLYVDLKYIFQLMIPFIHHYFHLKFPPNDFSCEPQQLEVIKHLIEGLFSLYDFVTETSQKEAVIKCLQAMCKVSKGGNQNKSMPQEFTQEIFKFLKEASNSKANQFKQHMMQHQRLKQLNSQQQSNNTNKKEDEDERYMKKYKAYVSDFLIILTQESNFANLGVLLYEKYRGYLDMIVNVIRRIPELHYFNVTANMTSSESNKSLVSLGQRTGMTNVTLYSLEMLKQIMDTQQKGDEKFSPEQRLRKLNKFHHDLTKAKIPELIIEMVCMDDHKIVKSAIELGIAMLFEGNNIVQSYIYTLFKRGGSEKFFLSIRDRIRLSIDEIKERKAYHKRLEEKKQDSKQARALKLRARGDPVALNAAATPISTPSTDRNKNSLIGGGGILGTDDSSSENNQNDGDDTQDVFEEKGHIEEILRFLQLMTEGHNADLQHYLADQKYNLQSVNIVEECLNFIVALEKDITSENIETAIQCFDSLTEFVQGPCLTTQQVIGMSPKFYFVCNEILSKDYRNVLTLDKTLELKSAMFICLTSLLEGSNNHKIAMIMRDSLNFIDIIELAKKCCIISFAPNDFLEEGKKGLPKLDLNTGAREEMASRIQSEVTHDGFRDKALNKEKARRIALATNQHEEIAFQIYFLLNTLSDFERIHIEDMSKSQQLPEPGHRKVTQLLESPEYARYLVPLEKQTGRMEIVRNNTLENVYYRIPEESRFLSDRSKKNFVNTVNSEEYTAQEKIRNFFDETHTFYTEIDHYKQFERTPDKNEKASTWKIIRGFIWRFLKEENWQRIKMMSFLIAMVINLIVLFGIKKMYSVTPGDIPLPGYSDPDDATTGDFYYEGDWKTEWLDIVQTILGVIQILTTTLLFITYLYFLATLEVKKKFKLKMEEKWEDLPRDKHFYKSYLKYLAQDFYIWFLVVYWVVSVLGLFLNPIIYSIHLFEVVVRFETLYDIVRSIQTTAERFVLTSLLMIVAIWFFSLMIFAFVPETFFLDPNPPTTTERQFLCDSAADCMLNTLNYGLRTGGFFEDQFTPSWGVWAREVINMLFILVVIVVLFEVVFGIILDSFAELRENREKTEDRVKNKCFICDIVRSRFDQKANEGITFNNHIKKEHNMWNYLFFLIYLKTKPKTEYTGSEQYVSNCLERQDISFYPILRSITLENVENKSSRIREDANNNNSHAVHMTPSTSTSSQLK
ncbi:hypothetical protein FDP41_012062 [Naegleria fowleri]|uniref:MIR domain-containing protein n=1 Tax=Naegleria fowleri TaxID=5763 RepID=A0A6A5C524_NAEFO|nr:uncharacterized protein FDP41_012062 [Naegleria fowleri]KAF0982201.1 hypothetical protein FDP41_012062 [Naegleria fowleri]